MTLKNLPYGDLLLRIYEFTLKRMRARRLRIILIWLKRYAIAFLSLFSKEYKYLRIVSHYEWKHREEFFYKVLRFIKFNQINGNYLEFGCYGGMTFRLAHKYIKLHNLDMHLYAFDSFQGLPKPQGIDAHPQWTEGAMAQSIEDFIDVLRSASINESEYTIIPGFYSETLNEVTLKELDKKSAALIYIDCDLYESTVPVLDFILSLLQTGTVLAFDDFYSHNGDPDRGGQLALREFIQSNSDIEIIDYLNFGWHGKSFIIKRHAR